jgi:hypothetical protein
MGVIQGPGMGHDISTSPTQVLLGVQLHSTRAHLRLRQLIQRTRCSGDIPLRNDESGRSARTKRTARIAVPWSRQGNNCHNPITGVGNCFRYLPLSSWAGSSSVRTTTFITVGQHTTTDVSFIAAALSQFWKKGPTLRCVCEGP